MNNLRKNHLVIGKKLIVLGIAILLFTACQKAKQRYTQSSPEIETVKAVIKDYENKDWAALKTHYADTSKTFFNSSKPMSTDELIKYHQNNDANYSSRGFIAGESEFEMVLADDGKTWVNFWGMWKATLAANGQEFIVPIHLTARFIDGKIVRDYGYWDNAPVTLALQKIEAEKVAANADEILNKEEGN